MNRHFAECHSINGIFTSTNLTFAKKKHFVKRLNSYVPYSQNYETELIIISIYVGARNLKSDLDFDL
jgi:hypothetical protein